MPMPTVRVCRSVRALPVPARKPLQLRGDRHRAFLKVEVAPAEAEEFRLAGPGVEGEAPEGGVSAVGSEESLSVSKREWVARKAGGIGKLDSNRHISSNEPLTQRHIERPS